ncbi:uncharacterized protein LOC127795403 [Diospyros lotus]|uniref:uncharacterized protein LOC127795403 n=1 Tax=Diospyros lotus TaxID=55363 RepID=UPI002257F4FE|nr:uncharacterized protein LOC127795403 [Diospyros lotus]
MCPILNSQAVVIAAAMAVSGTVILLALRLHKSFYATAQFPVSQSPPPQSLRSCLTPEWKKREDKKMKKKKRVRFAEDVVDTGGSSEEFRRRRRCRNSNSLPSNSSSKQEVVGGMPANRMALYNGILRDRCLVHHRLAYWHCF